ncbi:MAG: SPFH domain-containing protein, partial [Patescibacteria group bacterium]
MSKANIGSFYTLVLSCIGWIALVIPAFRLFFRTVGVYQVAHTQDMVTGKLRAYGAGTKLLLPWETLTEDKIVDTEAKLITIPETKVTTADGSPMLAFGQIRYRVARHLSHLYIGVKKDDVEKSLLAVATQITREEAARYADPEAALKGLPNTLNQDGSVALLGLIGKIEDKFMNGPQTTRIEEDHGIQVEGVPLSIVMAPETEKRFLERLEDFRLAESATALLGVPKGTVVPLKDRLEATRLALLNNPEAKLSHTISEEQETGDRTYNLNVGGTSGDS